MELSGSNSMHEFRDALNLTQHFLLIFRFDGYLPLELVEKINKYCNGRTSQNLSYASQAYRRVIVDQIRLCHRTRVVIPECWDCDNRGDTFGICGLEETWQQFPCICGYGEYYGGPDRFSKEYTFKI